MDLKDFIAETIKEISEGITNARGALKEAGCVVVAPNFHASEKSHSRYSAEYDIKDVEFDVAVTVEDKMTGDVKAGIKIVGAKVEGVLTQTNVSRIRFAITVGVQKHNPRS